MNNTIECVLCNNENAFYNGTNYECPDCRSAWDEDGILQNGLEDDLDEEYGEEELQDFKNLLNLKQPFFKLEQGKVHDCTVSYIDDHDDFTHEAIEIVPLAFKPNTNTLYLIIFQARMLTKFPNALQDLKEMSFEQINENLLDDYFENDINQPILLFAGTTDHGKIITMDEAFSDFKISDKY